MAGVHSWVGGLGVVACGGKILSGTTNMSTGQDGSSTAELVCPAKSQTGSTVKQEVRDFHYKGWFFLTAPLVQYQNEKWRTRGSLRWRISWNSSFGWLFGMFSFRHWKNHPLSSSIPGSLQSNLAILSKVFLNSVTWRSALQSTLFPRHLYHNQKRQISRSAI